MAANRPVRNRKAPSKLSYSVLAGDSLVGEFVQGVRKSTQSKSTQAKSSRKRRRGSDNNDLNADSSNSKSDDEVKKFKGVINTGGGRFRANITINGKTQYPGTFDTPKEAAQAHDRAAIEAGHPTSKLNFLDQVPKNYLPRQKKLSSNNTTGYRGVSKKGNRFAASISIGGKQQTIGTFGTAKEAAEAYDQAAVEAKFPISELNFFVKKIITTTTTTKKNKKMKIKIKMKKKNTKKISIPQKIRQEKEKDKKKTGQSSSTTTTTTTKSITTSNNHHSSLQVLAILSGHVSTKR